MVVHALRKALGLRRASPASRWGGVGCTGQVGVRAQDGGGGRQADSGTGAAGTGLGVGDGGRGSGGAVGTGGTAGGGTALHAAGPPIERRLWRLSAQQWGNAVRDLLGTGVGARGQRHRRARRVRLLRRHDAGG